MEVQTLPSVIEKYFDMHIWLTHKTKKFPRELRFFVGQSLYNLSEKILNLLIEAYYEKNNTIKKNHISQAMITLEQLRIHFRIAYSQKLINAQALYFATQQGLEVAKMLGGWQKSLQL